MKNNNEISINPDDYLITSIWAGQAFDVFERKGKMYVKRECDGLTRGLGTKDDLDLAPLGRISVRGYELAVDAEDYIFTAGGVERAINKAYNDGIIDFCTFNKAKVKNIATGETHIVTTE